MVGDRDQGASGAFSGDKPDARHPRAMQCRSEAPTITPRAQDETGHSFATPGAFDANCGRVAPKIAPFARGEGVMTLAEAAAEPLTRAIVTHMATIRGRPAWDEATEDSPIISECQISRIHGIVPAAAEAGAECLALANRRSKSALIKL
jgi:hypothetical protein